MTVSLVAIRCIFGFIFVPIIILGILGNIFVATVILDQRLYNTSINLFLLNLAFADLGNLLACCPDVAQTLIDHGWLLPEPLCPLLRFLQEYFLYASVLLQVFIGIERFLAICAPLHVRRLKPHSSVLVTASVWLVAGLFALPYLIYQRVQELPFLRICFWSEYLSPGSKVAFKFAEFIILYVLPLILLTVLYSIVCSVLWGKPKPMANKRQQASLLRLRRSVVKMLILSMLLYFICYSPIQGIFAAQVILNKSIHVGQALRLTLNALSFSSSSANPVVYIICCHHFRTRFLILLKKYPLRRYNAANGQ